MISFRAESIEDHTHISELYRLAFGEDGEAQLVDSLRRSVNFIPELSLVAEKDGQVVGHILFSPLIIEMEGGAVPALALAPMAVLPEVQNQGIGSELVRRGLEICQSLGHEVVVVVGHPAYYPRFGFSPARAKGLQAPFPVPDEAFLALELRQGALDGIKGTVRYPPEFEEV
jgi:putative acetyltransferase